MLLFKFMLDYFSVSIIVRPRTAGYLTCVCGLCVYTEGTSVFPKDVCKVCTEFGLRWNLGISEKPTIPRASLSGIFLQRKVVVNQCLEFAHNDHLPMWWPCTLRRVYLDRVSSSCSAAIQFDSWRGINRALCSLIRWWGWERQTDRKGEEKACLLSWLLDWFHLISFAWFEWVSDRLINLYYCLLKIQHAHAKYSNTGKKAEVFLTSSLS